MELAMKCWLVVICVLIPASANAQPARKTEVAIVGEAFLINGRPTYAGRTWKGQKVEGLLLNSRMVQGIFDDLNPETATLWAYPDTGKWDPERNTREFLAAMPDWRKHGLLGVHDQPPGRQPAGVLARSSPGTTRPSTTTARCGRSTWRRLERILDRADELGMVVILGLFYFGQDERLEGRGGRDAGRRRRHRLGARPGLHATS